MGMNFPDVPTNGQISGPYTWDGEKWVVTPTGGSTPSNSNPIMDSVAAPGVSALYSRGDHVHPSDTAKVAKAGDTMTGALTVALTATTGTYYFGSGGTKYLNYDGSNFTLNGGALFVPSGVQAQGVQSNGSGGVSTGATYYFGPGGTKYLNYDGTNFNFVGAPLVASSSIFSSGAIWAMGTATTGTYQFGNTATKYLNYDGTNFNLAGGSLYSSGSIFSSGGVTSIQSATVGGYYFGNSGTKYLQYDGINFNLVGGALNVAGAIAIANNAGMINVGYSNAACGATWRPSADPAYPHIFYNSGAGQVGYINTTASTTNYVTLSDVRLKEDLQAFDAGNIIDDTEVYSFRWKSTGERSYGVSAQQANEIYPQAVSHDEKEDWWGVDYSKYVPVLLQELKALRARVAQLEGAAGTRPA